MNDLFATFLATVHREYFSGFPLWQTPDGRIAGEYFKIRLGSRFSPVVDALGQPLGRAAELVAVGPDGRTVGESALARLTRVSESPVVLDRFIRCLHLLNHLREPGKHGRLFLPVSSALLERISAQHGRVFRQILDSLSQPPGSIAFLLPGALSHSPTLLARLEANYAAQGFSAYLPLGQLSGDALRVKPLSTPAAETPPRT
ncbi:hypothetical protein [Crenobacter cavernae]|uniref:Uncharacterized protein n=1 Tax=Crenobacter cavernae TaxID=2290923 RepID=A0ABY0FEC3_9NEIS|nr:hypothetical protein [Crenobacter cavernae]RXZ43587.1 hypothetical protein EBB06_09490 [Crenobacter cavernae]